MLWNSYGAPIQHRRGDLTMTSNPIGTRPTTSSSLPQSPAEMKCRIIDFSASPISSMPSSVIRDYDNYNIYSSTNKREPLIGAEPPHVRYQGDYSHYTSESAIEPRLVIAVSDTPTQSPVCDRYLPQRKNPTVYSADFLQYNHQKHYGNPIMESVEDYLAFNTKEYDKEPRNTISSSNGRTLQVEIPVAVKGQFAIRSPVVVNTNNTTNMMRIDGSPFAETDNCINGVSFTRVNGIVQECQERSFCKQNYTDNEKIHYPKVHGVVGSWANGIRDNHNEYDANNGDGYFSTPPPLRELGTTISEGPTVILSPLSNTSDSTTKDKSVISSVYEGSVQAEKRWRDREERREESYIVAIKPLSRVTENITTSKARQEQNRDDQIKLAKWRTVEDCYIDTKHKIEPLREVDPNIIANKDINTLGLRTNHKINRSVHLGSSHNNIQPKLKHSIKKPDYMEEPYVANGRKDFRDTIYGDFVDSEDDTSTSEHILPEQREWGNKVIHRTYQDPHLVSSFSHQPQRIINENTSQVIKLDGCKRQPTCSCQHSDEREEKQQVRHVHRNYMRGKFESNYVDVDLAGDGSLVAKIEIPVITDRSVNGNGCEWCCGNGHIIAREIAERFIDKHKLDKRRYLTPLTEFVTQKSATANKRQLAATPRGPKVNKTHVWDLKEKRSKLIPRCATLTPSYRRDTQKKKQAQRDCNESLRIAPEMKNQTADLEYMPNISPTFQKSDVEREEGDPKTASKNSCEQEVANVVLSATTKDSDKAELGVTSLMFKPVVCNGTEQIIKKMRRRAKVKAEMELDCQGSSSSAITDNTTGVIEQTDDPAIVEKKRKFTPVARTASSDAALLLPAHVRLHPVNSNITLDYYMEHGELPCDRRTSTRSLRGASAGTIRLYNNAAEQKQRKQDIAVKEQEKRIKEEEKELTLHPRITAVGTRSHAKYRQKRSISACQGITGFRPNIPAEIDLNSKYNHKEDSPSPSPVDQNSLEALKNLHIIGGNTNNAVSNPMDSQLQTRPLSITRCMGGSSSESLTRTSSLYNKASMTSLNSSNINSNRSSTCTVTQRKSRISKGKGSYAEGFCMKMEEIKTKSDKGTIIKHDNTHLQGQACDKSPEDYNRGQTSAHRCTDITQGAIPNVNSTVAIPISSSSSLRITKLNTNVMDRKKRPLKMAVTSSSNSNSRTTTHSVSDPRITKIDESAAVHLELAAGVMSPQVTSEETVHNTAEKYCDTTSTLTQTALATPSSAKIKELNIETNLLINDDVPISTSGVHIQSSSGVEQLEHVAVSPIIVFPLDTSSTIHVSSEQSEISTPYSAPPLLVTEGQTQPPLQTPFIATTDTLARSTDDTITPPATVSKSPMVGCSNVVSRLMESQQRARERLEQLRQYRGRIDPVTGQPFLKPNLTF